MRFTNFLLIVLGVCLIVKEAQQCDYTDDPPATNDQLYGPNMCCFFAIGSAVDINTMKSGISNVKKFGNGFWPKHKLAFYNIPDLGEVHVTAVEDGTWDLYGVAYIISVEDYNAKVKPETMNKQQRIGHAVTAKVTVEGKPIDCTTILDAGLPPANPPKDRIQTYVQAFTAAGFPQDYIDKVSQLPTQD